MYVNLWTLLELGDIVLTLTSSFPMSITVPRLCNLPIVIEGVKK